MVLLHGDLKGKAEALALLEDKLGFVEEWTRVEPEVFVDKVKGGDLFKVSCNIKLPHRVAHIETKEHRSVNKCFDELADRAKVLISKEKNKNQSKKRKRHKNTVSKEREEVIGVDMFEDFE